MSFADAHVHFFQSGYRSRYGVLFPREVAVYEKFRRVIGITDVLAIGFECGAAYRGNNQYLGRLAASRRWVHPLAYCSPGRCPAVWQVKSWWQRRFLGIALYVSDGRAAKRLTEWPGQVIAALNERRAIISINASIEVLPGLIPFLRRTADCRILVAHLGRPGLVDEWVSARQLEILLRPLRLLAGLAHVGVKASGFYACSARPDDFPHQSAQAIHCCVLDWFGAGRIYWGSDFSPALAHVSFGQTMAILDHLGLSRHERVAIAGENLRGLLGRHNS